MSADAAVIDSQVAARRSGMRTIKRVLPYLWPADRKDIRVRVVLALLALLLARVVAVVTPFLYKGAVDAMAPDGAESGASVLLISGAVGLTIAYGVARLMSVGFNQLRDVCLLYTSPSPRDLSTSRMPSSA